MSWSTSWRLSNDTKLRGSYVVANEPKWIGKRNVNKPWNSFSLLFYSLLLFYIIIYSKRVDWFSLSLRRKRVSAKCLTSQSSCLGRLRRSNRITIIRWCLKLCSSHWDNFSKCILRSITNLWSDESEEKEKWRGKTTTTIGIDETRAKSHFCRDKRHCLWYCSGVKNDHDQQLVVAMRFNRFSVEEEQAEMRVSLPLSSSAHMTNGRKF